MNLGVSVASPFGRVGKATFFFGQLLLACPRALRRPRLIVREIYKAGVLSMVLIVTTGMLVGMVLALQAYRVLSLFGAHEEVGNFIAFGVLRDLGPVLTALLFAGRSGTATASGIGLMNATNQMFALEMMSVDPIEFVLAPRFIAGIVALPLLSAIFSVMAIGAAGGYFMSTFVIGLDGDIYWERIHAALVPLDVYQSMIKSLVFAVAVSWIAVYEGYIAPANASGVARSVTNTAIISSIAVLALDLLLSMLMN